MLTSQYFGPKLFQVSNTIPRNQNLQEQPRRRINGALGGQYRKSQGQLWKSCIDVSNIPSSSKSAVQLQAAQAKPNVRRIVGRQCKKEESDEPVKDINISAQQQQSLSNEDIASMLGQKLDVVPNNASQQFQESGLPDVSTIAQQQQQQGTTVQAVYSSVVNNGQNQPDGQQLAQQQVLSSTKVSGGDANQTIDQPDVQDGAVAKGEAFQATGEVRPCIKELPEEEEEDEEDDLTAPLLSDSIPEHAQEKPEQITQASKEIGMAAVTAIAIPALGTVLADPLMSLVDTGCVGQVSTVQLAALSPNTAVFNLIFQVFTFLGVTTTNFLAQNSIRASNITQDERLQRIRTARRLQCYAMTCAAMFGVLVTASMFLFGSTLLTLLGASQEMMKPAMTYLRIRALASPAVMLINVSQGACMGQQNAWTPLQVCFVAGIINLLGDIYLTLNLGWGIAGAAVATTVSQYVGAVVFIGFLYQQGRKGKVIPLTWEGFPTIEALKPFVGVALSLLSRTMFTMCAFTAMNAAANQLGMIGASSHQVAMQIFWFLSFLPEPLSVAAQSLIAKERKSPYRVRRLAWLLMRLAIIVSAVLAVVQYVCFSTLGPWFSSNPDVWEVLIGCRVQAVVAMVFTVIVVMFDGICIGTNNLAHLPFTNLSAMAMCGMGLLYCYFTGGSLFEIWHCLWVFFGVRLACHIGYMLATWNTHALGRFQTPQPQAVPA